MQSLHVQSMHFLTIGSGFPAFRKWWVITTHNREAPEKTPFNCLTVAVVVPAKPFLAVFSRTNANANGPTVLYVPLAAGSKIHCSGGLPGR